MRPFLLLLLLPSYLKPKQARQTSKANTRVALYLHLPPKPQAGAEASNLFSPHIYKYWSFTFIRPENVSAVLTTVINLFFKKRERGREN